MITADERIYSHTGYATVRAWRLATQPGWLYRTWNAQGDLLYIGISADATVRLRAHRGRAWWPEVASIAIDRYPTLREAEAAEVTAIKTELPRHNIRSTEAARERASERATRTRRTRRNLKLEPPPPWRPSWETSDTDT